MAQFPGHKLASHSKHMIPSSNRYHVFLSFRGEDTRKNFTDHLYTALVNARFETFRDDPELERGENIKEKLEKAIQQSRSSVIVFSKDYTSSRWCLDELVMILERKRTSDHVVLPVFYDVDPSQLRERAETLSKVPKYRENHSSEKLNGWRAALREVADLAGMVLENEVDGHESKFIQNIVRVIQDKLSHVPLKDVEELLQKKLSFINPHINVAEGKQLNNPDVKTWLTDLTEAGYDIEDLLQEIKTEALWRRMEAESSSSSKVQELNSSLPTLGFDSALIQSRVQEGLNRVDFIMDQRRDVLGLEANVGYRVSQTLPTTSLVEDSGVCGRDDEKEKLIQLLLSDDDSGNKIIVIPIVGMGGIGKTTLAQLLYNDDSVQEHFDIRAWACVSENFDVVQISQRIYESLTKGACNIQSFDVLQVELQAKLMGKKFLLVLDDVWNKNSKHWKDLTLPFQSGAHGSKIIVTTRNQDVASMVSTLDSHHLKPISEEDGWSLFEKHAFRNPRVGARSCFEAIGRQIVRRCNGLPLAIKSLGGLLCSKSNVEEWETILNSEIWELPEEESDILPSLWLSYTYLPVQLKRCFAHCSIFHKNYEFERSNLILLWKAVGLLQPGNKKSAEEIGRDYFNDLISRSFFQHLSPNDVEYYTMHDLINDLASFVSGEFCARWEGSDSPKISSKTRHVNADFNMFEASYQPVFRFHQPESLRTLLLTEEYDEEYDDRQLLKKGYLITNLLPQLQCLRVLKLSGYHIEELPDSINNLKHLSHLDLSEADIKKLPDTICTLYNLQALLLSNCDYLTELPAKLGRLINLSHLDIAGTRMVIRMPPYMGNLKNLQMLPKFVLDRDTAADNLPELEKLQSLRGRLHITGLEHSSGLEADILREKKFLNELELVWGPREVVPLWSRRKSTEVLNEEFEERGVLEKLQPHVNLERLTIRGYGGKMFPGWPGFYSSSALVHLTLDNCTNCVSLPPLGQLPFLTELKIIGLYKVVSIGSEFYYGEGRSATTCVNLPFRSLQSLTFSSMKGWNEWCTFVGGEDIVTFPKLTTLFINSCHQLSSLPEKMDSHLPSLLSLLMQFCGALECIREGGFPSKLKSLYIWECKKLKMNSDCLRRLTSLKELTLDLRSDEKREDWIASEDEGLLPSSLTHLHIRYMKCETIDDGAKWFGHLNSLQDLQIYLCSALQRLPESGLPTSLRKLVISDCPALQRLPESGLPTSLRKLVISDCPALCLPESGLPPSLSKLEISECPSLEKRCQRETGEDWPKIAHIPKIIIDYQILTRG